MIRGIAPRGAKNELNASLIKRVQEEKRLTAAIEAEKRNSASRSVADWMDKDSKKSEKANVQRTLDEIVYANKMLRQETLELRRQELLDLIRRENNMYMAELEQIGITLKRK